MKKETKTSIIQITCSIFVIIFCTLVFLWYYKYYKFLVKDFKTSGMVSSAVTVIPSDEILFLTNQERKKIDLQPLVVNSKLEASATVKACDISEKLYWNHVSPEGVKPWDLINEQAYCYRVAGENLAKDFNDEADIVSAFMKSPTHRFNVLKEDYKEIGIGRCGRILVVHYAEGC